MMRTLIATFVCGWLALVASASTPVSADTRADDYEYNILPGNAKVEPWCFCAENYGYKIGVAFKGNAVYVQGVERSLPKDIIKGTLVEGDTVVFNNRQLIGYLNDRYRVYFLLMERIDGALTIADNDRKLRMKLDAENKVMTTIEEDSQLEIAFNYNLTNLNFISRWVNPTFKYQENFNGTPKNPFNLNYTTETFSIYGYNGFSVCLPSVDESGNILLLDDLYYQIYLNGEPMIFYGDEYNSLPENAEELELMPYEFANSFDINITPENAYVPYPINHHIGIYPDGVEEIGIQTVYIHDGETTTSELLVLDVETGETHTIGASSHSVSEEKEIADIRYYDLTGNIINKPSTGLFLEVTTFSDGTVKSRKKII